jgi:hypothetical protein
MQRRAEQSLTEEQMDFERQIEEYHRSLLIYSYKQLWVQQKLDTIIPESEMLSYYEENTSNFLLTEDVIKGTFVKVPLSAPRLNELRSWSWNNREEDLEEMEKYCLSYAEKFSNFSDTWVYFSTIKRTASLPDPGSIQVLEEQKQCREYRFTVQVSSAHLRSPDRGRTCSP